jgi:cellulose synthase/poly-beta-1,6-N-acetylglucosamine synthase-like glycosyltransferase
MKRLDAQFYTVVGAGELLAMRTHLYPVLDGSIILDDLFLSMHIGLQGYTVAYEPGAYAVEAPTVSLAEEGKRKVRIAAGAFQAIEKLSLKRLLHYPKMAFQYGSRRWLRWVVCPLFIPAVLILNVLLYAKQVAPVYEVLLVLQGLFYASAFIGWALIKWEKAGAWATVPFYFLFMNFCMLKGLFHYLSGRQTALWQKAKKEVPI